jgi:hypothetical protein
MHLLGVNYDNRQPLSSLFRRLQVGRNYNLGCRNVPYTLPTTTRYKLDPILGYCIDHPYIGDLILFRVLLQEHPWGMNVVLCNGENNAHFKNWTLCTRLKKV